MNLFIYIILIFISTFTITNAQNDNISFVVTFIDCGLTVTVGVDECVQLNACGYTALKVVAQFALQGDYIGNLYNSKHCGDYMPAGMFFITCSSITSSGTGGVSVTCIRPGVTSNGGSGLSLSSATSSMTSAVTSISNVAAAAASSSSSSAGGTGTPASSLLSSLSSSTVSLLSSSSSSSSSTGGIPGSNCVKDISKSQLTVTYNSNSPYIQCNGATDLKCGAVTCFNQKNSTITCYGINNIQCQGSSFQCSIGDTQICNLNWIEPPATDSSDSSNSTITKTSNSIKLQPTSTPFLIISSIIISVITLSRI